MSKGWKTEDKVLFKGGTYAMDSSHFEVFSGRFENADLSVETRVGVRWVGETGANYPRGKGFALPSRPEEIRALIKALESCL